MERVLDVSGGRTQVRVCFGDNDAQADQSGGLQRSINFSAFEQPTER